MKRKIRVSGKLLNSFRCLQRWLHYQVLVSSAEHVSWNMAKRYEEIKARENICSLPWGKEVNERLHPWNKTSLSWRRCCRKSSNICGNPFLLATCPLQSTTTSPILRQAYFEKYTGLKRKKKSNIFRSLICFTLRFDWTKLHNDLLPWVRQRKNRIWNIF